MRAFRACKICGCPLFRVSGISGCVHRRDAFPSVPHFPKTWGLAGSFPASGLLCRGFPILGPAPHPVRPEQAFLRGAKPHFGLLPSAAVQAARPDRLNWRKHVLSSLHARETPAFSNRGSPPVKRQKQPYSLSRLREAPAFSSSRSLCSSRQITAASTTLVWSLWNALAPLWAW